MLMHKCTYKVRTVGYIPRYILILLAILKSEVSRSKNKNVRKQIESVSIGDNNNILRLETPLPPRSPTPPLKATDRIMKPPDFFIV